MTFVFVHLTGSHRGRTDRFHALPVTLGTSPEADVRFSGKDRKVQPEHARVVGQNGGYRIQAGPGAALLVNGVPVESAQLLEGDLVQVGEGGPRLRFRVRARVRRHKAVREMWSDCRDVAGQCRGRLSYAGTLARQVWREGVRESSRTFRLLVTLALLVMAGFNAYLVYENVRQKRLHEQQLRLLAHDFRRSYLSRDQFEQEVMREKQRLQTLLGRQRTEIGDLTQEFRMKEAALREELSAAQSSALTREREILELKKQLRTLQNQRSVAERMIKSYAPGVCFIHGAYGFVERDSGRSLRFAGTDERGNPVVDPEGNAPLSLDGKGPTLKMNYTGTGFLVAPDLILTNRHVALPWENDEQAGRFLQGNLEPRFLLLRAYFPGLAKPFSLRVEQISDRVDLASMRLQEPSSRVPLLALDPSPQAVAPGQPILLMGYPAGVSALLARSDEKTLEEIQSKAADLEQLVQELSDRQLIRPLATQGHVGDVLEDKIVYDAQTTSGGSGGPVFNFQGRVIGVNFAVLREFGGSNFGIPIRHAQALMGKRSR